MKSNSNSTSHAEKFSVLIFFMLMFSAGISSAQENFSVSVSTSAVTAAPAVHSFAFAQYNGKWIFIGGRTNGLHQFEPPFAFQIAYANHTIFVVDPLTNQGWLSLVDSLPDWLTDQQQRWYDLHKQSEKRRVVQTGEARLFV